MICTLYFLFFLESRIAREGNRCRQPHALGAAIGIVFGHHQPVRRRQRIGGIDHHLETVDRHIATATARAPPRDTVGKCRQQQLAGVGIAAGRSAHPLLQLRAQLFHPLQHAMADLRPRDETLRWLNRLPELLPARDSEVLALVDRARLYATGIGYIDAHLITAVRLVPDTQLWTRDKRLRAVAERLSIASDPT